MRLSQRAWNNVIIFAMLVMIVLFNLSDIFKSDSSAEYQPRPLLPDDALVMTIELDGSSVERIGQGWRQTPVSEHESDLAALVQAWQSAVVEQVDSQPELNQRSPQVVIIWLAGESQGRVFEFYPQQSDVLLRYQQSWYRLLSPGLERLINA
ncbi:hypothetical protein [Aestuariibacter salexigens]|uniref:hypothetical protein n=1 Tax=Aestuariibacter salexigens TaxID=226010 RepID=UPI000428BAE1|nr:hypothetical protein [Aestuariibacter salexigens]